MTFRWASALSIALLLWLWLPARAQEQPLADPPTLSVKTIRVLGNTLLPDQTVREVVAPFEGRNLDLDQLRALAESLETTYHEAGFLLVKVTLPPQKPDGGLLVLQVIESRIAQVEVEGNQRYSEEFIKSRFEDSIPDQVYRTDSVERSLLLLNELPDVSVKALLRPGAEDGTTNVLLKVEEDKNYHFTLEYNNFGTRLTGEHRFGLTTDLSSLLTQGDRLVLGGTISTPASGTSLIVTNYDFPVGDEGTRLAFGYASGAFAVGQELALLDIRGDADIYTFRASHPITRSLTHNADIGLSFSQNDIRNLAVGRPLSTDTYSAVRLDLTGQWIDLGGRTVARGVVSRGLGGTQRGDRRASRAGAGADFTKFGVDLVRLQQLDDSLQLVLRGSGQMTSQPLFSSEQFALGGPDSVRGFPQAELLGDAGYNFSSELRWSPLTEDPDLFQTVFFLDYGGISQAKPVPGQLSHQNLTGAGLGFRVNFDQTRVRLDLGFPLAPSSNSRRLSPVLYGRVVTRF
ncbi:MAG: ShlB/FhaC/HecB family hemolysin secretion/activation protein [Candidatus Eremiobacteraeota bacterium]|nr:ShlB/FhaC/HecB family hemolysin secretion/activation protein [Candidatus Eremiobacteraeota bacterium]